MRLIDADELIEKYSGEGFYTAAHIREAIDGAQTFNPWHRVEEPPKEADQYFVLYKNDDGEYLGGAAWFSLRLGFIWRAQVAYWMPIEPPKEEA